MEKEEILRIMKMGSGYHAEIAALDVLRKHGLDCDISEYYVDKDSEKPREIDILAKLSRIFGSKDGNIIEVTFICDVVSSSAPIVILSSGPSISEKLIRWDYSALMNDDPEVADVIDVTSYMGHAFAEKLEFGETKSRIGRYALKILDKQDRIDKNKINESWFRDPSLSVLKASGFFSASIVKSLDFRMSIEDMRHGLSIRIPMIILDAPLFEHFYENGEEKIENIEWAVVKVSVPYERKIGSRSEQNIVYHKLVCVSKISHLEEILDYWRNIITSLSCSLQETLSAAHKRMEASHKRKKDPWGN